MMMQAMAWTCSVQICKITYDKLSL